MTVNRQDPLHYLVVMLRRKEGGATTHQHPVSFHVALSYQFQFC